MTEKGFLDGTYSNSQQREKNMLANIRPKPLLIALAVVIFLLFSQPAHAYIGPGAGLTAIGSFIALIFAVLVAIVGFLWYPIKRMLKKRKNNEGNE